MLRTKQERGIELGGEKDQIFIKLFKLKAPYTNFRKEILALEKRWLGMAKTEAERRQVRRGTAEDLVFLAFAHKQP